ncbi:MAG: transporter substrate-binding domain-containing protein [Rhodospirillales bacterium]|nr:transporter substrate-binding domain-containing protein [Rhodospirillales bacterium]
MRALLLVLATLLVAPAAHAAEMRLVAAELPPFTYHVPPPTVSEIGEPRGLVYELVREMARRIGHSGTIDFMGWTRAQELALIEPNIGILALTRSPEREPFYNWMVNIVTDDLVLVGGAGVDVASVETVKDRPTGVLRTSGAEALLRELKFTRIEPASEEWVNAMKLRDRRIDAWLAPRLMVLFGWREIGGDAATLNIGRIVRPSPIYFAASRDVSQADAERWREAFAQVRADGTYDRILTTYRRLKVEPIPEGKRRFERIEWGY